MSRLFRNRKIPVSGITYISYTQNPFDDSVMTHAIARISALSQTEVHYSFINGPTKESHMMMRIAPEYIQRAILLEKARRDTTEVPLNRMRFDDDWDFGTEHDDY